MITGGRNESKTFCSFVCSPPLPPPLLESMFNRSFRWRGRRRCHTVSSKWIWKDSSRHVISDRKSWQTASISFSLLDVSLETASLFLWIAFVENLLFVDKYRSFLRCWRRSRARFSFLSLYNDDDDDDNWIFVGCWFWDDDNDNAIGCGSVDALANSARRCFMLVLHHRSHFAL